jgi:hypothetical protein
VGQKAGRRREDVLPLHPGAQQNGDQLGVAQVFGAVRLQPFLGPFPLGQVPLMIGWYRPSAFIGSPKAHDTIL